MTFPHKPMEKQTKMGFIVVVQQTNFRFLKSAFCPFGQTNITLKSLNNDNQLFYINFRNFMVIFPDFVHMKTITSNKLLENWWHIIPMQKRRFTCAALPSLRAKLFRGLRRGAKLFWKPSFGENKHPSLMCDITEKNIEVKFNFPSR